MKAVWHLLALAGLLAAAAGPAHAAPGISNPAGPAPVTLFFHLAGFQDFPINTQEPPAQYVVDGDAGITQTSSGCVPVTPAGTGQTFHTLYGFSSPGFVEYAYVEGGQPRFHPERGLSYDVRLAGETLSLHWYASTQLGAPPAGGQDPNAQPVPAPKVTVEATLRTGEAVRVGNGGYDDGQLLAQGRSEPATLAGPATRELSPAVNWTVVGDRNVYEIVVPLTIRQAAIPAAGGFALRVDTFVDLPGPCSDPAQGYVAPNAVQVHSSPGHRPRLQVSVDEPVRIEYVHPQFVGDLVYVHTSANSPWGNYDVDARNSTLSVAGPTAASSLRRAAVVQRTHEHGSHTQPVDITYEWAYARDAARSGAYTVTLAYQNLQHTATAQAEAQFVVGDDRVVTRCGGLNATELAASQGGCTTEHQDQQGNPVPPGKSSPGAAAALLAGLPAAAMLARRRRQP